MKKLSLSAFAILSIFLLVSCGGGTQEETTPETDTEETTAEETAAPSGLYAVDISASTLTWKGSKKLVPTEHTGNINLASGQVEVTDGNITAGNFVIDMTSITDTDLEDPEKNAKLVGHLQSDDFFGVETFPNATFVIKSAEVSEAEGATHNITGDLTIKGITNSVTFPATVSIEGDLLTAVGNITFDRSKYDVRYGSDSFFDNLGDGIIKDKVDLTVELAANKAGA